MIHALLKEWESSARTPRANELLLALRDLLARRPLDVGNIMRVSFLLGVEIDADCMRIGCGIDRLMTPGEAARALGVTVDTLANWAKRGKIGFVQMPSGRYRYKDKEIRKLLRKRMK